MPTLAEGEARTIVVAPSGPPSNTLTAVLPPGVTISLESVLAAIDASGAGDTTALLEIADSSGAVIARKAQGQVVTGGSVGSATWALRLGDDATAAPPPPVDEGIQFTAHGVYGPVNTGDALFVNTTAGSIGFDTALYNLTIQAANTGLTVTNVFIGPFISFNAGSASFGIGTGSTPAAGNDIDAGAANFRITLGTGGDGFKIVKKAGLHLPIFRVRNAGGSNSLDFYNQAGNPIVSAGIVAGPLDAIGFFGALVAKQAVAGSRGGNVALANLLTALANYGLIVNNTTP